MDKPIPSRRGSYFSTSLWLIAAALLAWAICSLTLSPGQPPGTGELISNPTTEPAAASGSRRSAATVRLYDVHDMIDRWSASQYGQPGVPVSNTMQQGALLGQNTTTVPTTQPAATDPMMDALVQLILEDIQSDQWMNDGGTTAAIQYCHHTLIIGGSPSLHRDIEKLLRNLRAADASTPIVAGK